MFYFVRVNGDTLHNDPNKPRFFVPNEPPQYPRRHFNYLDFCLARGIIRIGWPDTGDLTKPSKTGALAQGYSLDSLKPYIQNYLLTFRDISVGSVILMPNKSRSGDLYMGKVIKPYHYYHNIPEEPYECAHRLSVKWHLDNTGQHRIYRADALGIETNRGSFWGKAFWPLDKSENSRLVIPALIAA